MTLDVSIVIPTYNQKPEFLAEAIESALLQSYPADRYEILVVDDGSTKILPDLTVMRFKEKSRLRLIKKNHGGIGNTLNTGIQHMNGRFFKWLSSDDALVEDSLEIFMSRASEKMVTYGNWLKIDNKSHVTGVCHEPIFDDLTSAKRYLWNAFFGNGTASLIPKSAFHKVGLFDCGFPYIEDYDWWLRAMFLHQYEFESVNEIVAKYRFHQAQLTTTIKRHPTDAVIVNWLMKKRLFDAMAEADQMLVSPAPTLSLLGRQLIYSKSSPIYHELVNHLSLNDTDVPFYSIFERVFHNILHVI